MAPGEDSQRLNQALQSLREARAEISSEARWLREELDPWRIAHRAVDRHTTGILFTSFAAGMLVAWLIFRDQAHRDAMMVHRDQGRLKERARNSERGFLGTLVKAAMPLAFKLAMSKPVVTRIIGGAKEEIRRRARAAVP